MPLPIDIVARYVDHGAQRGLAGLEHVVDRQTGSWRRLGTVAKWGAAGVVTGAALAGHAIFEMGKNASEDEAAQRRLALGLRNTTGATHEQVAAVEAWIAKQGVALGVTDDELRPAMQKLVQATGNVSEAEHQLGIAMDVSAGRGKSLKVVSEALEKANNGTTASLSRLGLKTKDAHGKALSLNAALDDMAKKYGGQAAAAAATLEGKQARLNLIWDEAKESLGGKFLPIADRASSWMLKDGVPAATKLANTIGDELGPTFEDLSDWARNDGVPMLKDLGDTLRDDVLPPFRATVGTATDAARAYAELPAPVRSFGIELAASALLMPRFTGQINANTSSFRGWIGQMRDAETRGTAVANMSTRLAAAFRTAAGVGGAAALTSSFGESNTMLQYLERTAGGAAVGLSVGGPLGAAIGGLAGASWSLYDAFHATDRQVDETKQTMADYSAAVDETTGKLTKQARASVVLALQQSGLLGTARMLGISTRDIVSATLGSEGAIRRINKAYHDQDGILTALQANKIATWIHDQGIELTNTRREAQLAASGYTSWGQALKGIPREVRVRLRNMDYEPSLKQWRTLNREIDLTPRQRQIIIKAIGYDPAIRGAKNVQHELDKVGNKKADLSPFMAGLQSALTGAQQDASSGGVAIGDALQAGVVSGFSGTADQLSYQAANAVRRSIEAARAAGRIQSPSKEMDEKVGHPLGKGLNQGFLRAVRGHDGVGPAGVRLIDDLVNGIHRHWISKAKVLDAVREDLRSRIDKLRGTIEERDTFASGFGRLSTSIFAADYTSALTQSRTTHTTNPLTGEVTSSTTESQRPLTITDMIAQARGQKKQAGQVEHDVKRLLKLGLSKSLIQQMQAEGDVAGIHALALGDRSQIRLLNNLNKATQDDLSDAGMSAANKIYREKIERQKDRVEFSKTLAHELSKYLDRVEFRIHGDDLRTILRKKDRTQGHHS